MPLWLKMVAAPGYSGPIYRGDTEWQAKEWCYANVDWRRYKDLRLDGDGRATYPTLIPGATFRIWWVIADQPGTLAKDFTVQPGETVDLGQAVVKPGKRGVGGG